ncbi:hypothetical protein N7478_004326 [Penicillium angulare]|uniref:uncharacterized protein n=1 Tax=Penicillium angulare TaxID=116970 RepID=UPI0025402304|nr:uncharacterized protein N7478_004326 [Penicillium angulare]KAJ5278954.1 hypothetical protein N7478_004326 [Penicillium angulare]
MKIKSKAIPEGKKIKIKLPKPWGRYNQLWCCQCGVRTSVRLVDPAFRRRWPLSDAGFQSSELRLSNRFFHGWDLGNYTVDHEVEANIVGDTNSVDGNVING